MQLCCKCGLVLWILPCQITKCGQFKVSKWPLVQNLDFLRGPRLFWPLKWPSLSLVPFKGPKKSWAPQKVKILCRDHLEILNWPHWVIWQGRIHNTTPHLQHRCMNSYHKPMIYGLHPPYLPSYWIYSHQKHYVQGRISPRSIGIVLWVSVFPLVNLTGCKAVSYRASRPQ